MIVQHKLSPLVVRVPVQVYSPVKVLVIIIIIIIVISIIPFFILSMQIMDDSTKGNRLARLMSQHDTEKVS